MASGKRSDHSWGSEEASRESRSWRGICSGPLTLNCEDCWQRSYEQRSIFLLLHLEHGFPEQNFETLSSLTEIRVEPVFPYVSGRPRGGPCRVGRLLGILDTQPSRSQRSSSRNIVESLEKEKRPAPASCSWNPRSLKFLRREIEWWSTKW